MGLTLTIADHADGTGATAAVAGSGGAAVAVYRAAVAGDLGAMAWAAAGTRTGDGTLAVAGTGYFLWYAAAGALVSPPAYQPATDGRDALHDRIFDAAAARVALLNLAALGVRQSYVRRLPTVTACEFPCLVLTTFGKAETELGGLNVRDDSGYPVYAVLVDREPLNHGEVPPGQTRRRYKLWRQLVKRAFREQRLPGVTEVMTCRVEDDAVVTAQAAGLGGGGYEVAVSALVLRFICREPRGLGV